MNGNESYVLDAFKKGDISWFPAGRSLRLERAAERHRKRRLAEAGGEEIDTTRIIEIVEGELERIEEKVRDIIKKF